jgi:hypothetical protein
MGSAMGEVSAWADVVAGAAQTSPCGRELHAIGSEFQRPPAIEYGVARIAARDMGRYRQAARNMRDGVPGAAVRHRVVVHYPAACGRKQPPLRSLGPLGRCHSRGATM